MGMKNILRAGLSCVLAVSVVGALVSSPIIAAEGDIEITTIEVTGFEEPSKGSKPDHNVTIVAKTAEGTVVDAVDSYSIEWSYYVMEPSSQSTHWDGPYDLSDDTTFGEDKFFEAHSASEETEHMVGIAFSVLFKQGYVARLEGTNGFNGDFLVNGKDSNRNAYAYINGNEYARVSGCGTNISFQTNDLYKEEPTPITPITTIEVTGFDEPSKGNKPDTAITIVTKTADGTVVDAISDYSVEWYYNPVNSDSVLIPSDTVFGEDEFWNANDNDPDCSMALSMVFKDGYVPSASSDETDELLDFDGTFTVNGNKGDYYPSVYIYADSTAVFYAGIDYPDIKDLYDGNGGGNGDPAPITIASIEVTDLADPEAGKTLDKEVSVVAKTKDGKTVDAIDSVSLQWTFTQFGKETGEDWGGGIIPDGTIVSEEFFSDDTVDEDLTFNVFARVTVGLKDGYELADESSITFTLNGEEAIVYDEIDGKASGAVKFEKIEELFDGPKYVFLNGANSEYEAESDKDLAFRASGKMEDCTGVEIDGELVDPENYVLTSGSTIITFKPAYLSTLKIGTHTITVLYGSDKVSTKFKILPKADPNGNPNGGGNTPATGDSNKVVIYTALCLISIAGLVLISIPRKKTDKS